MTILCLPGLDGTGQLFDPFLAALPVGYKAIILSYPNDMVNYRDIEGIVVNRLPLGTEYMIIAESFSGPIALKLITRGLVDLKAVILISSFAYRPLRVVGRVIAQLPLTWILRLPLSNWLLKTFLLGAAAPIYLLNLTREVISRIPPEIIVARLREVLTSDFCLHSIDKCGVRVLALNGSEDRLIGSWAAQSILEVYPKAEMIKLPTPHLALQAAPTTVVSELQRLGIL